MDELYARARRGLAESWRAVTRATPGGETLELPGCLVASMGIDLAGNNRAFIQEPAGDPRETVARIVSFFAERSLPFTLEIREELPGGFAEAATDAGLNEQWRDPTMVLSPIDPARLRDRAEGVEIREAMADELEQAGEAAVRGFGGEGVRAFATPAIAAAGCRHWIGLIDGRVVATSLMYAHEGSAGIYFVSTLPEYRRRGIGEAVTAAALRRGATEGCDMAYLQASEDGYPVYERMGFRTVGYSIAYRLTPR